MATVKGIEGPGHERLVRFIHDINDQFETPILNLDGQGGSPIFIRSVEEFAPLRPVALFSPLDSEWAFIGLFSGSLPSAGRGNNMGTRIAGRAILVPSQCTIELASFLLQPAAEDLLLPVFWHELGHCAGLPHTEQEGELMSPVTLPFFVYTQDHLSRFFDALWTQVSL